MSTPTLSTATYGSNKIPCTLIPGDGIGPEIVEAVIQVLDALGAPFAWDRQEGGMAGIASGGDPLPPATLESIRRTRLALKGPLTTPVGGGFRSVNVRLREEFQLYANLRPARTLVPGGRYEDIDLVLVRENLEGLYVGFEHYIPIGDDPHAVAIGSGVNTRAGCRRIVRFAFEYAREARPQEGDLVHKANVLKALTGVFLEAGRDVAKEYEGRIEMRRPHRGRLRHAAGAQSVAVRHDRHHQPVRRHPVRPDRRAGRRAGHGARRQHRRERRDLRGGARLRARHRRQGHRQPDRAAAGGGA